MMYDDTRENLSGLETEEMEWYEHNRKLLNEIGMITHGIEVEGMEHRKKMENLIKEKQNGQIRK